MAKRAKGKPVRPRKKTGAARSGKAAGRPAKRPSRKASSRASSAKRAKPASRKPAPAGKARKATKAARTGTRKTAARRAAPARQGAPVKTPRIDRVRRRLTEPESPPSSLNMNRRASAARSGRAEMAQTAGEHRGMSPDITAGDVDVDVEDAYFTGDEAPGGDNPTPDQDIVDDIGKALGVQYGEGEELKSTDKITERDRHRWEMDPASSEDYKERKR